MLPSPLPPSSPSSSLKPPEASQTSLPSCSHPDRTTNSSSPPGGTRRRQQGPRPRCPSQSGALAAAFAAAVESLRFFSQQVAFLAVHVVLRSPSARIRNQFHPFDIPKKHNRQRIPQVLRHDVGHQSINAMGH